MIERTQEEIIEKIEHFKKEKNILEEFDMILEKFHITKEELYKMALEEMTAEEWIAMTNEEWETMTDEEWRTMTEEFHLKTALKS